MNANARQLTRRRAPVGALDIRDDPFDALFGARRSSRPRELAASEVALPRGGFARHLRLITDWVEIYDAAGQYLNRFLVCAQLRENLMVDVTTDLYPEEIDTTVAWAARLDV